MAIDTVTKSFVLAALALTGAAANAGADPDAAASRPLYVTTQTSVPAGVDAPYNVLHRPEYGGPLSGVARLNLDRASGSIGCTGALLGTGRHLLTAAHCVTDTSGQLNLLGGVALFPTESAGPFGLGQPISAQPTVGIVGARVLPGWEGTVDQKYLTVGHDLAILTLAAEAPADVPRYDIYTGSDELGRVTEKVGWGSIGQGDTGYIDLVIAGWRTGSNKWEMTSADFFADPAASSNILWYDFDNGLAANDAFGVYKGLHDLGLGDQEVMEAPGDSGGPSFIDGRIAGVTSFNFVPDLGCGAGNPDVLCGLNSSFGEFGGDTRVSGYSQWILSNIPEPGSGALLLLGLGSVAIVAGRGRKAR